MRSEMLERHPDTNTLFSMAGHGTACGAQFGREAMTAPPAWALIAAGVGHNKLHAVA
jgi:hypothetical protein